MNRFKKLDFLRYYLTDANILDALVKAMSEDEFDENFEFICRDYNLDIDE